MRSGRDVRTLVLLAVSAALIVGCAPAVTPPAVAPSPPASATATAAVATPPSSPTTSTNFGSPSPSPSIPPVGVAIPAADAAWVGVTWRKLAGDDPLAQVSAITRWPGGFVAVGAPVATDATSRTPVWTSADGATWHELDPAVLGPASLVIGVVAVPTGLVALTVQGGSIACDDPTPALYCTTRTGPLQAWTSADASSWVAHPGPESGFLQACETCDIDLPLFAGGAPGLLVTSDQTGTALKPAWGSFSRDGITWQAEPANAFPAHRAIFDIAVSGSRFILAVAGIGAGGDPMALTSADGLHWKSHHLSTTDPSSARATQIFSGRQGVLVTGSEGGAPGLSIWWSSVGNGGFKRLVGYPPLGVFTEEGAGSGALANGELLGDGERIVAYRPDSAPKAWTSPDGRTWQAIAIDQAGSTAGASDGPDRDYILTPVGLLAHGSDGSTWLGSPR